ncbi:hypothetical protein GCM10010358_80350 [Streptomyces minutiscleroticus]|uniref:Transposase IS4-like domain-containing protein n=1 Tax=Streptomyces minutiscleroticus TaxID=68238 RepID=A0A918P3D6_9ACTN|nr:hypothetical protein GCM10010358_80350 [Streptomyces minutiscleroticus]
MNTEAHGIPPAVSLTGGNRNDVTHLMPLLQAVPSVRGRRGRPRRRPEKLHADRGYDHDKYRKQARALGVTPVIAHRGSGHGSGLGAHRWVVEQSCTLLHRFRRLRIRWEIRDDIHEAFLSLACGIICRRRLRNLVLWSCETPHRGRAARAGRTAVSMGRGHGVRRTSAVEGHLSGTTGSADPHEAQPVRARGAKAARAPAGPGHGDVVPAPGGCRPRARLCRVAARR